MAKISENEFEGLNGEPKKFGKKDPNSLTNRVFDLVPKQGGVDAEEITTALGEEARRVKNILNALCYDKVKNEAGEKVTKVVRKYNETGIAFYKRNPDFPGKPRELPVMEKPAKRKR
jgi:hypothetical protein